MSSNDERRIPMDPERMVFSTNPEVAELQKWRHYACCLLGLQAMRSLTKHGLVVVPREYVPALNPGDGASPNQKDQQGDQRLVADPTRSGQ